MRSIFQKGSWKVITDVRKLVANKGTQEEFMEENKPINGNTTLRDKVTERNPELTKKKILDSARLEFSQQGLGGARVNMIAKRAGVNKQLIYYYFTDKDGLYREVLK